MQVKSKSIGQQKLVIIMPAYNAGKTIARVFDRIPPEIHPRITEYVVVNDGSTDDTGAALARLKQRFPNLVVLDHGTNKGYGVAEKTLLKYALGTDADIAVLFTPKQSVRHKLQHSSGSHLTS